MKEEELNTADRFRTIRDSVKMGQTDFAKALGFSQSRISTIERGLNGLDVDVLRALYDKFKVSPLWMMTGVGDRLVKKDKKTHANSDLKAELEMERSIVKAHTIQLRALQLRIEALESEVKTKLFIDRN